jgi:hypothetical protein
VLEIGLSHALAVRQLPHHHRDPFDRMLAAQAKIERLRLVSGDGRFDAYDIERIWVGSQASHPRALAPLLRRERVAVRDRGPASPPLRLASRLQF